jgi:hypothetical protein
MDFPIPKAIDRERKPLVLTELDRKVLNAEIVRLHEYVSVAQIQSGGETS